VYHMTGKRTSVYLNPNAAELAAARGDKLSRLIERGASVRPLLIEESYDAFETHWYCEVPPRSQRFRVLRDLWYPDAADRGVREVYEIELLD
jgi:hypothetical protein